jgi:hypothetical protein
LVCNNAMYRLSEIEREIERERERERGAERDRERERELMMMTCAVSIFIRRPQPHWETRN